MWHFARGQFWGIYRTRPLSTVLTPCLPCSAWAPVGNEKGPTCMFCHGSVEASLSFFSLAVRIVLLPLHARRMYYTPWRITSQKPKPSPQEPQAGRQDGALDLSLPWSFESSGPVSAAPHILTRTPPCSRLIFWMIPTFLNPCPCTAKSARRVQLILTAADPTAKSACHDTYKSKQAHSD